MWCWYVSAWQPITCQRDDCASHHGNAEATKVCLDPVAAIQVKLSMSNNVSTIWMLIFNRFYCEWHQRECGDGWCIVGVVSVRDWPPPLYICSDCAVSLRQDHPSFLTDILRPIEKVAVLCENKVTITSCSIRPIQLRLWNVDYLRICPHYIFKCAHYSLPTWLGCLVTLSELHPMAAKNQTVCMCFSLECASFNGNKPIRFCRTCHELKHADHGASPTHAR